jgi:glycosyltransferase involved in cell wall biosynthesis
LTANLSATDGVPESQVNPRISVVINTLNEEQRLGYALRSVKDWADEIVVVDMHSDDRTADVAASFGAKVLLHERIGYADPARTYAVEQSTGDWILILDADELIQEPLSRRLRAIAANNEADAVYIHWRNYLLGAALSHTGWGPHQDRHVRFFRRNALDLKPDVHNFLKAKDWARVLDLGPSPDLEVIHFNYLDVTHFVEKMNRYTSIEAAATVSQGEKTGRTGAIQRTAREFVGRYLRRGGYRDGWRGFYLSGLMAAYRFIALAKAEELRRNGSRTDVEATYGEEAERVLEGYRLS